MGQYSGRVASALALQQEHRGLLLSISVFPQPENIPAPGVALRWTTELTSVEPNPSLLTSWIGSTPFNPPVTLNLPFENK